LRLEKIAKAEKIEFTKEAFTQIATAAKGSFRDAVKLLEQIWLSGGKVDEKTTGTVLGNLKNLTPGEFLQLWENQDVEASLLFIGQLVENGVNIRNFVEKCIEELRGQLLQTRSKSLIAKIEKLDIVFDRTKQSAISQLPLEMMILEDAPDGKPTQSAEKALPEKKAIGLPENKHKLEDVTSKWPEILKAVRPKNHSVEALLRATSPVAFDGEDLLLEVFYKFHKDKLETDRCRKIVEESVKDVLNSGNVKLKLKLTSKQVKQELAADVEEDIVKAAAEIFKVDAL